MRIYAIALALMLSGPVQAATIVDTGTPPDSESGWIFSPGQYFAGKFSVADTVTIDSIEGYLWNYADAGSVSVYLFDEDGNVPGNVLQSATFELGSATSTDWYGAFNLGWTVAVGTYWAAFVPDEPINGGMPSDAPSPMAGYAIGGNGTWYDSGPGAYDFVTVGMRIISKDGPAPVPVPAAGLMLVAGLGGLAAVRKRKAA